MKATLPLFPDLIEQADPFNHNADYRKRGFGVWSFHNGSHYRRRSEHCSEARHLCVIYDDERSRFKRDGTKKFWTVEVRHYFNTFICKARGPSEMRQRVRYFERSFAMREEALALAEKLLGAFRRINARRETNECQDFSPINLNGEVTH